jgi:hypothetical protein
MKNRKWWIFLVAPPAAVLFVFLFGEAVKYLWNWLVPALFTGAHLITFWQALGLLLLSRILFGSWHGNSGHGRGPRRWSKKWQARWESMTPEEREAFRQRMSARCGHWPTPEQTPGPGPA